MNNKWNIVLTLFSLGGIFSCTKDIAKPVKEVQSCNLPAQVSYKNDIQKLFDQYCNTAGCHTGNNAAGNLNLDAAVSYSQVMNSSSGYVDTLQPKYSLLYAQMRSVSNPMPPTGKLDDCKIEMVLKWIEQKAKNN